MKGHEGAEISFCANKIILSLHNWCPYYKRCVLISLCQM